MEKTNNSLKHLFKMLGNLIGSLFVIFPALMIVILGSIGAAFYYFFIANNTIVPGLCFLVTIASVIIYGKTKKYGETALAFILGLFTVFSITWDVEKAVIFTLCYAGFNLVVFFVISVSLKVDMETHVTNAATFMDLDDARKLKKKLEYLAKQNQQTPRFSPTERAIIIEQLAYAKIPFVEMKMALKSIEIIMVVFLLSVLEASNFYKTIYNIRKRTNGSFPLDNYLDIIVKRRLPMHPKELVELINKCRNSLISGQFTIVQFLDRVETYIEEGIENEEICKRIKGAD